MPPATDHGNQAHGRGFVGLLCAAIIASAAGAAALAGEDPPRVTNAWIRWLPGGIPMAAYVTIVNPASRPITLVGVRSAKFADSSIHQDVHVGTNVEMRPVNRL